MNHRHLNPRSRLTAVALMILLALSLSSLIRQAQSQPSVPTLATVYVHAHNPEGVEIGSIDGVNYRDVKIYYRLDTETSWHLLGYGTEDAESHPRTFAIEPYPQTIKTVFNGIELTQHITDTATLVFEFPRISYHDTILSSMNVGGTYAHDWCGHVDCSYSHDICSLYGRTSVGKDWKDSKWNISMNSDGWSGNWREGELIPISSYGSVTWGVYYLASADFSIPVQSFDDWYAQAYFPVDFDPSSFTSLSLIYDNTRTQSLDLYPYDGYPSYWIDTVPASENYTRIGWVGSPPPWSGWVELGYWYYDTPDDIWTVEHYDQNRVFATKHAFKFSSVPYDLAGTGVGNHPPVASFTYSPEAPMVGEEVAFNASSSYDPDGEIVTYSWDLGDGSSTDGEVVVHAYSEPRVYTVTLTVTDNDWLTDSIESSLEVKTPVLLVHGYCSSAAMWGPGDGPLDFKQALEEQGFLVETIELIPKPTNDSIWNYGSQLFGKIAQMKREYEVDQVDIVAHSLGGLAARAYALQNPSQRDIRTLIMLGTPNNGSGLLSGRYWPFLRAVLRAYTLGFPPCEGFGDAGVQMRPGSPFLGTLNGAGLPSSIENYYTIAGHEPFPPLSWFLSGPNDGVVEVASVQAIAGTTDSLAYVNHFKYEDDTAVLDIVVNILRGTNSSGMPSAEIQHNASLPNYQESVLVEDSVTTGEEHDHVVPIDSTVSEARFVLGSSGGELSFTLTSPGGRLITPTVAASDPVITYTNAITTLTGYIVVNPEPGSWTAHVAISGTASSEVNYAMLVLLDSDLGLSILLDEDVYHMPVPLTAQLVNTSDPVAGATMVAQVKNPDGSTQSISLYDDGSHGDGQADDGIYSNLYTNAIAAGAYEITVTASGTIDDEQFARETATTIWVEHSIYLPLIMVDFP
jgi:PKD repeat protein